MAALTRGDVGERELVAGKVRRLGQHVLPQRQLLAQGLRFLPEVRLVCTSSVMRVTDFCWTPRTQGR